MLFPRLLHAALAVAVTTTALIAAADPVTVGFRVAPTSGPLAGTNAAGTLTYDTSIIPAGGGSVSATGLLTDLSFTFNGITYDESSVNTGSLAFNAAGMLTFALFGTDCPAGACALVPDTNSFLVAAGVGFGTFAYTVPGSTDTFGGDASLIPRAALPEPASGALVLIGLGALAVVRRRKQHFT